MPSAIARVPYIEKPNTRSDDDGEYFRTCQSRIKMTQTQIPMMMDGTIKEATITDDTLDGVRFLKLQYALTMLSRPTVPGSLSPTAKHVIAIVKCKR